MNEDWRVGDLAECIASRWADSDSADPVKGEIRRVSGIIDGVNDRYAVRVLALSFEGYGAESWCTTGFRKIRPLHEPAEEEFTALIKRPVRTKERA